MRTSVRLFLIGLPLVLVLGASPARLSSSEEGPTPSRAALRELIAEQSNLDRFYLGWQKGHLARGGDRDAEIHVSWTDSLSTEPSPASGRVRLDLIAGSVRAEVRGLTGPVDLWLVDNQEGPGRTVRPEPGDRMIRVGRLEAQGEPATLSADLGPALFRGFELDLAVVSAPGRTPAESRLLVGARSFFERLYTRTRVAREREIERSAGLLAPASSTQVLADHGLVSQAVADGADLFFRETFGGNGRTCGTCHRAENNLALDLDFIAHLPGDDKLFIAELPASGGGVPGLERPALMRGHAQILMNSDGFERPTEKFVMRAPQHTLSLATSILRPDSQLPIQRTGWSGDAAAGNGALRLLPTAAVKQHFTRTLSRVEGTDFVLPTDAQLDAMEAFTLASGRLNELNLPDIKLTNTGAQAGKAAFLFCNICHTNAGAALFGGVNINATTGVERAPDASQATEPHPHDGGMGAALNFNFDCDGDGTRDCFGDGSFNVPPLIEAADTEPFFHNHSAATIEDAVRFYTTDAAFFGAPFPLTETDVLNVAAFLRVLNAAFNSAISIQRNTAALTLEKNRGEGTREVIDTLLALSNSEALDAIEVLSARKMHAKSIRLLNSAIAKNGKAMAAGPTSARQALIRGALKDLKAAKAQLGTGLDFVLGEGNLLF
jgi:mono/diheme cytochrome c family protein